MSGVVRLFVSLLLIFFFFFFQAEDGIRDVAVTGVQTCALPICRWPVLELIWPNALEVTVVFGLPKCGVFVAPNHSVRNWKFTRSVSLKVRKRLASRLKMPGPRRYGKLRPALPNATVPVGTGANAEIL